MTKHVWPEIDEPIARLAERLRKIENESVRLDAAVGRVLSGALLADRDSPAADVSAMDGYALRREDLSKSGPLTVSGQSVPGTKPPDADPHATMRVFTGGIVPQEFDLVVRREDTDEGDWQVTLKDRAKQSRVGENIRRRGENAKAGARILEAGSRVTATVVAAAANFGVASLTVAKKLRVAILTTGDELLAVDAPAAPWQLRDSNGPTLQAIFTRCEFLQIEGCWRVADDPFELQRVLAERLQECDAVFLTGGVSMGDFDFVPEIVRKCGGEIVFHKLPIRPGKPILGAVGPAGQLVMGLPGNPVSAAVCAVRFGMPLLASLAGIKSPSFRPSVTVPEPGEKTLPLHWFRLVTLVDNGVAKLMPSLGSGDLVSLAKSSGFIHVPPECSGSGPWPYWSWSDVS